MRSSSVARHNTLFLGAMFLTVTVMLVSWLLFAVTTGVAWAYIGGISARTVQ